MKKIFFNYQSDSGCPYHRILMPVRYCSHYLESWYGCEVTIGENLPLGYDIYVMTGLLTEKALLEVLRLKHRGCQFVWSIDDDWLTIPDWNPSKPTDEQLMVYHELKRISDWVIVSTSHLATTLQDISEKVLVAKNLIDITRFPYFPYQIQSDGSRIYQRDVQLPIRIVWSGSMTHYGDILQIVEPLEQILSEYTPDQVAVIFQGMFPPSQLTKKYLHKGLVYQQPVPFAAYQNIINAIAPDIYLAPLAPIEFNLSKSNLRIMDGWGLMSCVIASDFGEYRCIQHEQDGLIVGQKNWYELLKRAIDDHEYRIRLAANGRQRVEKEYNWNKRSCILEWCEIFAKILGQELNKHLVNYMKRD